MKSVTQLVIASLIMIKIFICFVFIFQIEFAPLFWSNDAIASEPQKSSAENRKAVTTHKSEEKKDFNFIVEKMDQIKKKEQELEKREAELKAFQDEINNKIELLSKLRREIKSSQDREKSIEAKKIKHLIKAYSAMKSQSAAGLIEKLDKKFAVELLSQMKGEEVGKILTFVEEEKAAKLIEGLAKGY